MSIFTRMLKQTAVYWAPAGTGQTGETIYAEPIEIRCRWEDLQEQFIDGAGTTRVSKAKVYVDRDVGHGGYLFEGTFGDLTSHSDPHANDGAYEIMAYGKIPNMRAKRFLRYAML
jgi:hypothetical protein